MYKRVILLLCVMVLTSGKVFPQRVSIATDLVDLITLSPNINADLVVGEQLSINLDVSVHPFDKIMDDLKLKHLSVSPEIRYWFKRPLYSHYIGANILFSDYDLDLKGDKYLGSVVAVGIGYGYSVMLSSRWNLIPNIGVGYGYQHSYGMSSSGMPTNIKNEFKPVITRIGVSFSYIID